MPGAGKFLEATKPAVARNSEKRYGRGAGRAEMVGVRMPDETAMEAAYYR